MFHSLAAFLSLDCWKHQWHLFNPIRFNFQSDWIHTRPAKFHDWANNRDRYADFKYSILLCAWFILEYDL